MNNLSSTDSLTNVLPPPVRTSWHLVSMNAPARLTFDNGSWVDFANDPYGLILTSTNGEETRDWTRRTANEFALYLVEVSRRPNLPEENSHYA